MGAPTAQSVQMFRWDAGTALSAATQISANTLPQDMQFQSMAGLPNGAATVPDGFGNATKRSILIGVSRGDQEPGDVHARRSAHDVNGNLNSGIMYLGTQRGSVQFARSHSIRRDRQDSGMASAQVRRRTQMVSAVRTK